MNPPVTLSKETLDDLRESQKQRERGETSTLDEVAEKYDVDPDK